MSRSQNLRHNVINQVIDDMARGHIPSPLPSQSALAEMYNISRTTVRHILSHLRECGVLTQVGNDYVIARKPDHDDGFACTTASMSEQNKVFEQAFFTMINQRQLRPGETFSELQLARAAGVSPVVVREYLLKFGRYNLIQSEKRVSVEHEAIRSILRRAACLNYAKCSKHIHFSTFSTCLIMIPAGCRRKPCSNVIGYCVTTSAIAFACSRNLTEIFTPYCFQLPTISFLINLLRSSQSSFIFTINGTKAILNSAISLPSMSI